MERKKEIAMGTSDVISLGSLIISTIALIWSATINRRLNKQQRVLNDAQLVKNEQEQQEARKACIKAELYRVGEFSKRIRITNDGSATARNVRYESSDIEREKSGIRIIDCDNKIPYPLLHSGESFDLQIHVYVGSISNPIIKFIWDDDFAKENEREQVLDV